MNFNVFKFYFFAKNSQHSLRTFPACHAFAPVSLASHIDHASISAFPRPCFTAPWEPISGCVCMAYDRVLTTSLFQIVCFKQTYCKLIVQTCYQLACCKLFQQIVPSLQIKSCDKLDFNRLVATCLKIATMW